MRYLSMLHKISRKLKLSTVMLLPLLSFTSCGSNVTDYYIHGGRDFNKEEIINVDEEVKKRIVEAVGTAELNGYGAESQKSLMSYEDEGEEKVIELETFLYAKVNVLLNFDNKYFEENFIGKYVEARASAQFFSDQGWIIGDDFISLYNTPYTGYFFKNDPENVQKEYDETAGIFLSFFFPLEDEIISRAVSETFEAAIIEKEKQISDEFHSKLKVLGDVSTGTFSLGLCEPFFYKDDTYDFKIMIPLFRFDFKEYLIQESMYSYKYSYKGNCHAKEMILKSSYSI